MLVFEPAYIHQSEGRPGQDIGTGWVQNCRLSFDAALLEGALPELPCNVMDGDLTIGNVVHNGAIPMPLSQQGAISLRLLFYPGCEPTISGTSVELETTGIPHYVENFEPHTQNGTIAEQAAPGNAGIGLRSDSPTYGPASLS